MSPYRFVAILCIAPVALAGAPRAAYADDAATRTAKRHYERGEKLYALGKFADALDEFTKAYDAKTIPALLFNIAQCHRGMGDYDSAIFSYKKYLELAPDAPNRDEGRAADRRARGQARATRTRWAWISRPARRRSPSRRCKQPPTARARASRGKSGLQAVVVLDRRRGGRAIGGGRRHLRRVARAAAGTPGDRPRQHPGVRTP